MIRRQCWDHLIVSGEGHLRRNLISYSAYYNSVRTHRSLHKDAPIFRPTQQIGIIRSHPILGGLHIITSGFEFSVHTGLAMLTMSLVMAISAGDGRGSSDGWLCTKLLLR